MLSFALNWTDGRRSLLEAGADPLESVRLAMEIGDLEALQDLLDADCPFFFDLEAGHETNLLHIWSSVDRHRSPLMQPQGTNYSVESCFQLILRHLVQLREQLSTLGQRILPVEQQKRLGITEACVKGTVLDKNALDIYEALETTGFDLHRCLWPGRQASVYHLQEMDTPAAVRLFDLGFHDVDVHDAHVRRPIELACILGKVELILWFLEHGVSPYKQFVWPLARRHSIDVCGDTVYRIISMCGYPEVDHCRCHCSSSGCLPSTILVKSSGTVWRRKNACLKD